MGLTYIYASAYCIAKFVNLNVNLKNPLVFIISTLNLILSESFVNITQHLCIEKTIIFQDAGKKCFFISFKRQT